MTSERGTYRHPKHDAMVSRLRAGGTNSGIAAELGVNRQTVARVRELLGIPPYRITTTLDDKLDKFSTEPDAAGHVLWTGRRGNSGTPLIRHRGTELPASNVAFERRTGRKPVGTCRSDCDVRHCLAPAHVQDDLERRTVRMQERALHGLEPQPWDECPEGHEWAEYGRVEPDLTTYCKECAADRARRTRAARADERNES